MKIEELRSIAKAHGLQPHQFSITELIREVQAAEGNHKCFATNNCSNKCAQVSCCWREACLAETAWRETELQTYSYKAKPQGWHPGLL